MWPGQSSNLVTLPWWRAHSRMCCRGVHMLMWTVMAHGWLKLKVSASLRSVCCMGGISFHLCLCSSVIRRVQLFILKWLLGNKSVTTRWPSGAADSIGHFRNSRKWLWGHLKKKRTERKDHRPSIYPSIHLLFLLFLHSGRQSVANLCLERKDPPLTSCLFNVGRQ